MATVEALPYTLRCFRLRFIRILLALMQCLLSMRMAVAIPTELPELEVKSKAQFALAPPLAGAWLRGLGVGLGFWV